MEERLVPDGRPLPFPVIFAGAGEGQAAVVKAYDADTGALRWSKGVFGSEFTGGVRVAAGDITGDGIPDAVLAPGAGTGPQVIVLDGTTGNPLSGPLGGFLAFDPSVTGGVFVASADVNGDGRQDVVAAALTTAGPRVKVFSGTSGAVLADFTVAGSGFAPGITVAAADFTGDNKAEVVVGGAVDGRVRVYNPLTGAVIGGPLGDFQAFGTGYTGGVFVGTDDLAGDVDADGTPDLAVGTGAGATARVRVFSGATGAVLYDFQPFGPGFDGGARVALAYADDDNRADVVVGSGPGEAVSVQVFSGATGTLLVAPLGQYSPFGVSVHGTFVGASNDPPPESPPESPPELFGSTVIVSTTSPTAGQTVEVYVRLYDGSGTVGAPTGSVTARLDDNYADPNNPDIKIGTYTLVPDGTGVGSTVKFTFSWAKALNTVLVLGYSGDANYPFMDAFSLSLFSVSAPGTGVPAPIAPSGPGAQVSEPTGSVPATSGTSPSGVNYGTGDLETSVCPPDLASFGFGDDLAQARTYTTGAGYADGTGGTGVTGAGSAHLVQVNGNDSLALVTGAGSALFFDYYGGAYHARYGSTASLTRDAANGQFVVTDGTGRTLRLYDFSGSTPSGRTGKLTSTTDADGLVTEATSWSSAGNPTEVRRTTGSGGGALTESFVYAYVASGTNAGLVQSVTQRTQVGSGSWSTVRTVEYTYHDGTTSAGTAGALRTATVKDASGSAIDTAYYRYYTSGTGSTGKLKYAFGNAAYGRLVGALGTSIDGLTDGQVDDYADKYAAYDSSGRATTVIDAAAGCSVCSGGQGVFTYSYTANPSPGAGTNAWAMKTVETLPDGSTNTVYTNALGQVMLAVRSDGTSQWRNYTRYDADGRVVLQAGATTVTGFSESYADLVNFVSGNATYLSDTVGQVTTYTYGAGTTATTSTAGDALGYLKQAEIKQGETGTAIPQQTLTYIMNTVGGINFFHLASETVYRNDNGTGGQTTGYSYTFLSGTNQVASTTVTLPTVTTAQNGSNSATTVTVVNDAFGRPVWAKDQAGFISYTEYDTLTGAVVKTITDVNTASTSTFANLPSGWSTPSGAGLHLTTTFEVDALGRTTKVTHPNGRIDYTVYNDAAHEVRSYVGWDSATNRPTGPTTVTRTDRTNGYTETLTMSAAPAVSGGRPTGAESISQVQSLSRSYVNAAGQVTHTDAYFDLGGLGYSTSVSLGTEGVNFYRTRYQYDDTGAVKRAQTAQGTITRTVRDALGRVVSEWLGTDDTPTTGFWSPTNTAGTNLVKVREYQYDSGGVGDGNLTLVTEYPGGGAAARVTQTWFDWRNRAVAVKSGVETTEATDVNRPLVVSTYDNLGRVTLTQAYDGDGVTPSIAAGVLSLPAGTNTKLRAQTATNFDELGRAFSSQVFSVNPANGTVSTNSLVTSLWYDARGLVIKQSAPNGLVQKSAYDGAGRLTVSYTTDWGNDTGYADAAGVAGETVLEQVSYAYDASGNVLQVTTRERNHDATGTGTLGAPSGIAARTSFVGYYYDLADRQVATVNVGTNGGTAWSRPGTVPTGSATVLVTQTRYATDAVQDVALTGAPTGGTFTLTFGGQTTAALAYNASPATVQAALEGLSSVGAGNVAVTTAPGGSGWEARFTGALAAKYQGALTASGMGLTGGTAPGVAITTVSAGGDAGQAAEATDTAGRVSRSYADALGRTVRSIQNFVNGVVSDTDDKTVGYTYNGAGVTSLTAYLTGGGGQTTEYLYGVSQSTGSAVDSFDAVGTTRWPDPTTGIASTSEQEVKAVNAVGQALTATDRNGSVHTLTYDVLGRVVSDAVTTLGSGVSGAVRRVETAYNMWGGALRVTSYDAASGGSIVNQVLWDFNGLGQMITEWQSHGGAVNTSTSPKVQYAYNFNGSGTTNQSRLTSITYPSGYVLTYNYASGINNAISRLSSLSDTTGTVESYSYLGLGTVVVRAHPQPNVDLSYVKLAAEAVGDAGDQYTGLDRFGRVVDQRWLNPSTGIATDRFQYGYDAAGNRTYRDNLTNSAFGEVYSYDALDQLIGFDRGTLNGSKTGISGTATRTQDWDYDAAGNWDSVITNGTTQTRTANAQNEITGISGATTPTYDANGSMTGDEAGRQFVYDAWNRLVAVKSSGGTTLKTYSYDGLNRRVSETATATSVTTDLYYSSQWQVLEEKVGSGTTNRYVWSPVYVDAMVLRDRDTDTNGTLDERLWVQQDANWNITALVDGSGITVERYAYDPFGVRTELDAGFIALSGGGYSFKHGFQGMAFDESAGINPQRNRWYSPTIGRWVSVDPLGYSSGETNFYLAVGNSPLGFVDPNGFAKVQVWITFASDGYSGLAGFWHSATATGTELITLGILDGRVTIKTTEGLMDAVKQLKSRLGENDCISFLEFAGHGEPGNWYLSTKKDGGGPNVLMTSDLDDWLAGNTKGSRKEVVEALQWLKSKICTTEKVRIDLMLCNQADGPTGVDFCKKLAKGFGLDVYGNDDMIKAIGTGQWWRFPACGDEPEKQGPTGK